MPTLPVIGVAVARKTGIVAASRRQPILLWNSWFRGSCHFCSGSGHCLAPTQRLQQPDRCGHGSPVSASDGLQFDERKSVSPMRTSRKTARYTSRARFGSGKLQRRAAHARRRPPDRGERSRSAAAAPRPQRLGAPADLGVCDSPSRRGCAHRCHGLRVGIAKPSRSRQWRATVPGLLRDLHARQFGICALADLIRRDRGVQQSPGCVASVVRFRPAP